MKLSSQLAGTLPSQIIAVPRLWIMVAPVSLAALIISTTMPDGPAALSDFIFEMAFFTMSIGIRIGGPSSSGLLDRCSGSYLNSTFRSLS